jgi:hypothetical protein
VGVEPTLDLRPNLISNQALSATQPPLRTCREANVCRVDGGLVKRGSRWPNSDPTEGGRRFARARRTRYCHRMMRGLRSGISYVALILALGAAACTSRPLPSEVEGAGGAAGLGGRGGTGGAPSGGAGGAVAGAGGGQAGAAGSGVAGSGTAGGGSGGGAGSAGPSGNAGAAGARAGAGGVGGAGGIFLGAGGAAGAPTAGNGIVCTASSQCQTGFCVDGVCCNAACTGACRSCALAGSIGTCVAVSAGSADPRHVCVVASAATCGTNGLCDGNGSCQRYPVGTTCAAPSCASGTWLMPAATCDANGACVSPPAVDCTPNVCSSGVCRAPCGDIICNAGFVCAAGQCVPG